MLLRWSVEQRVPYMKLSQSEAEVVAQIFVKSKVREKRRTILILLFSPALPQKYWYSGPMLSRAFEPDLAWSDKGKQYKFCHLSCMNVSQTCNLSRLKLGTQQVYSPQGTVIVSRFQCHLNPFWRFHLAGEKAWRNTQGGVVVATNLEIRYCWQIWKILGCFGRIKSVSHFWFAALATGLRDQGLRGLVWEDDKKCYLRTHGQPAPAALTFQNHV